MSYKGRAQFNTLLTKAFGAITSSYSLVGTIAKPIVAINFKNAMTVTDGDVVSGVDVFLSFDGTNDHIALPGIIPAESWDIRTNAPNTSDYLLPAGTTIYAKTADTPDAGAIYIEAVLALTGNS